MKKAAIGVVAMVAVVVFVVVWTVGDAEAPPRGGADAAPGGGTEVTPRDGGGPGQEDPTSETTEGPTTSCDDLSVGAEDPTTEGGDGPVVEPGESIQEALDAAGEGATVIIGEGTHVGQSMVPLTNQVILGEPGAVLDGDGAPYAFRSEAPGVTIRGLAITGYSPAEAAGVIHAEPRAVGWVLEGNHIHSNGEIGIYVRRESTIANNSIHHNGRYGISGRGSDLTVTDNVIACNAVEYGPTGDSGGTKFVFTTDLLLEGNQVIANQGNGLWVDINNVDAVVRGNHLVDNLRSGVFIEISCGGLVESNNLEGNSFGSDRPRGVESAAIYVANTPGVTVRDNSLRGNAKGIGAIHWEHPNRSSVDRCAPELRDLMVTDNSIVQSGGVAIGLDAHLDGDAAWEQWGNTFMDNRFDVTPDTAFRWRDRSLNQDDWEQQTLAQGG